MLVKNQTIIVNIDDLGMNGEGIAHFNGMTIFIKGALKDEQIQTKIILVKPTFCIGIIEKILIQSIHRIVPKCENFLKCGGCNLQHLDYDSQLNFKRNLIQNSLHKIAKIDFPVSETVRSDKTFRYRNKMSLPVRKTDKANFVIGFFRTSSHSVVKVNDCFLQPTWNSTIIDIFTQFMTENNLIGYDESNNSGDIRHIVVREQQVLSIAVVTTKKMDLTKLDNLIKQHFSNYSLWQNINNVQNNVILGKKWYFEGGVNDNIIINDISIKVHPAGFFQVNDHIRQKMYDKVIDEIQLLNNPYIIDAYSGAGLLTAQLSKFAKRIYGIEINDEAHQSAKQLIATNNITNMYPIHGDVKLKITEVLEKCADNLVVVLDPPRSGCDKEILIKLASKAPEKIIYISCNYNTLSRDLTYLLDDYDIKSITPYDMFPQSTCVETLAVLTKKKVNNERLV